MVAALLAVWLAHAGAGQEPPSPHSLRLVETAPGEYRLDVRGAATALGPYEVKAHISRIGTDQGVLADIAESDDDSLSITLSLPFTGMTAEGCYRVGFFVRAASNGKPGGDITGAGLDTRGCIDAAGVVTFPEFDRVSSPPPSPPRDVRLVFDERGEWVVTWTDTSADELSFDAGIVLLDRPLDQGGTSIGGVSFPEVPANQETIGPLSFFGVDAPAPAAACGYALVLVFAVGGDSPSLLPGNSTRPFCFDGRELSFPATGAGDPSLETARQYPSPVWLAVGGLAIAAGGLLRRRARSS